MNVFIEINKNQVSMSQPATTDNPKNNHVVTWPHSFHVLKHLLACFMQINRVIGGRRVGRASLVEFAQRHLSADRGTDTEDDVPLMLD